MAAGLLAAGVALGVGELAAGIAGGRSLVIGVGDWVIDHAPRALVRFGTRNFGTDDKAVLVATIVVASLLFGGLLGLASRRRRWIGAAGIGAFGVVGFLAALDHPLGSTAAALATMSAAVAAGVSTLWLVLRVGSRATSAPMAGSEPTGLEPTRPGARPDRRAFLEVAAGAAIVASVTAVVGRSLLAQGSRALTAAGKRLRLPAAGIPAAAPTPAMTVGVDGVTPLVTRTADFYRIDTALAFPSIDHESWRLRIHGMVDGPYTLTLDELVGMELVERYVTLACVSNEVGGDLISTALWRGVRLRDLLERAGVHPRADQVVGRSVDGFTVGFPTRAALDDRDAMVALGMNGSALPVAHGFPARLIVPGLYGYVSATKWLSDIELARFDSFDAYWVKRGWAQQAPIKTQSRIDVPSSRRTIRAGTVPVAGVAWAPTRGITDVEVQVDDRDWKPARLADELGNDTWRQWVYRWDATPGEHRLRVRATDGTGTVQDAQVRPPEPNGATGYHTTYVNVRD